MTPTKPVILNIFKPKDYSSQNVVRNFKRKFPKKTKIGHFGTLDPFACGVLMLGVNGAQRLNEFIHNCLPKTYIATGILGMETPTGDLTAPPSQTDKSEYLNTVIQDFSAEFIEEQLCTEFMGEYWQAPHTYSAAKHEGKPLHEWARAGVEIQKEKKKKFISKIEVLDYSFPRLKIRFEVSSGTYIRSLFSECARKLGTLGVLEELEREKIGGCTSANAIKEDHWDDEEIKYLKMDEVLDFSSLILEEKEARLYSNGVKLNETRAVDKISGSLDFPYFWIKNKNLDILGLAEIKETEIYSIANFSLSSL